MEYAPPPPTYFKSLEIEKQYIKYEKIQTKTYSRR